MNAPDRTRPAGRLASAWATLRRPPGRTLAALVVLGAIGAGAYAAWSPGRIVTDGSCDRGANGLWLQHGWLADDAWFVRNDKRDRMAELRDDARVAELGRRLREHHVTDVFPHVCPAQPGGALPPIDPVQTDRFLRAMTGVRVLPWVGGVLGRHCHPKDEAWRAAFVGSIRGLLAAHPSLSGIHLNIEPWPSGDRSLLELLDELRAALPPGKLVSVAAYPPPTRWHPHPDVHWDEAYYREVARRADQLVVMMYDTALRLRKVYVSLMADWTREVLAWSGTTPVLLGLPAYEDAGVGYHDPDVESLSAGLEGIHSGLASGLPASYQGVALYADWVVDEAEWRHLREHFLRVAPAAR